MLFILGFEREERKRRRREEKEKKVTRAGIEPTAAAPSQPARLDVSRSDHSAGSKESASLRAVHVRTRFGLTRSTGVGQREKEGKEARESSQDEPALEKGERQLKSAKIEIIWCREEKYRF